MLRTSYLNMDRNLAVDFLMYECAAVYPNFVFAKWCLTKQAVFQYTDPDEFVSFAIDNDEEEHLQWMFSNRTELYQPHHLGRAAQQGIL